MSSFDPTRITAICFDVDGTLRDTDDQYAHRFEKYFRPFRPLLPGRDVHRFARRFVMWAEAPGNLLLGIPDRLHLDDELSRFGDWLHTRGIGAREHEYALVPGVREMLEKLRPHYKMAVVSARPKRGTQGFLDHFGFGEFFDCVASAQTAVRTKPWPDPVIWAMEQMGAVPEETVMVGDTTVDLRAGQAAGTQTVGVLCGFGERGELERQGADLILDETPELAGVLLARE
ncbi:MAG TPA: HAD family hydrolase [Anaerolineales bacterium]|nr:HAD family hydrolase [Anaerolineales bacterium]